MLQIAGGIIIAFLVLANIDLILEWIVGLLVLAVGVSVVAGGIWLIVEITKSLPGHEAMNSVPTTVSTTPKYLDFDKIDE